MMVAPGMLGETMMTTMDKRKTILQKQTSRSVNSCTFIWECLTLVGCYSLLFKFESFTDLHYVKCRSFLGFEEVVLK